MSENRLASDTLVSPQNQLILTVNILFQQPLDITYIRLAHGFAYLVAVMDWYSRRVLSRRLSNTLESDFCVEVEPGTVSETFNVI